MITVNLNDPNLKENLEAIKLLKDMGIYTDEELQEMYNRQVEIDKKKGGK